MCDFLVNLYDFFAMVCTGFHEVVVFTRYGTFKGSRVTGGLGGLAINLIPFEMIFS